MRLRAFSLSLALLLVPGLVLGCAPAYRLDLEDSSWIVRKIDSGEIPVEEQATIAFFETDVRVTMNCGSVTNVLFLDTDGSGLHFMASDTVSNACGGATSPVEHAQLDALHGVESWRIIDDNHIVLEGEHEILLERAP